MYINHIMMMSNAGGFCMFTHVIHVQYGSANSTKYPSFSSVIHVHAMFAFGFGLSNVTQHHTNMIGYCHSLLGGACDDDSLLQRCPSSWDLFGKKPFEISNCLAEGQPGSCSNCSSGSRTNWMYSLCMLRLVWKYGAKEKLFSMDVQLVATLIRYSLRNIQVDFVTWGYLSHE